MDIPSECFEGFDDLHLMDDLSYLGLPLILFKNLNNHEDFTFENYFYSLFYVRPGNDSNLLIVFYVQIMPDDFVMQLHRF